MTTEERFHSALKRITSLGRAIKIREEETQRAQRHGTSRESGLEAVVPPLEALADQFEEALKS